MTDPAGARAVEQPLEQRMLDFIKRLDATKTQASLLAALIVIEAWASEVAEQAATIARLENQVRCVARLAESEARDVDGLKAKLAAAEAARDEANAALARLEATNSENVRLGGDAMRLRDLTIAALQEALAKLGDERKRAEAAEAETARLQAFADSLAGERFSDRNHAALRSRTDTA